MQLRSKPFKIMPSKTRLTKCKMFGKGNATINHILSVFTKLAHKEYKRKHCRIGRFIHCEICGAKEIPEKAKWQNHQSEIAHVVPYDTSADDIRVQQIDKYLDLPRELKKVWNINVKVVLEVIGALGTPAKNLKKIRDHWY